MSRRIDLELTSARPDGTWTWRAAGAREPRGVLPGTLLPSGVRVGDVLKADAEFDLDGITVLQVFAGKGSRKDAERLEVIGSGRAFEPVMQTLAPRGERHRDDRDRGDRGDRPDRPRRPRPEGDRGPTRSAGDRPARGPRPPRGEGAADGERAARRDRPARPPVPELPSRPKAKRLRPGRTHRTALLASLSDDHKVIAEQVLRGGVPAVRQAVQEQNVQLRAAGQTEIKPGGLVTLAEELLPKVRAAEWLDRAEAAAADLDELDLRDLRSVVAAAGDPVIARESNTHDLAEKLKAGLARRQDSEHEQWLGDIVASLDVGRLVRALRLSSRPPKAGVRFPVELGQRLTETTVASLGPDASGERWVAVLDALAYSPIRAGVKVTAPANPSDDVKSTVARLAGLLPEIATAFGLTPPPPGSRSPRPPRPGRPPGAKPAPGAKRHVPPPPSPTLVATAVPAPTAAPPAGPADSAGVSETVEASAAAAQVVAPATDETAPPADVAGPEADVAAPAAEATARPEEMTASTAEADVPAVESAAPASEVAVPPAPHVAAPLAAEVSPVVHAAEPSGAADAPEVGDGAADRAGGSADGDGAPADV